MYPKQAGAPAEGSTAPSGEEAVATKGEGLKKAKKAKKAEKAMEPAAPAEEPPKKPAEEPAKKPVKKPPKKPAAPAEEPVKEPAKSAALKTEGGPEISALSALAKTPDPEVLAEVEGTFKLGEVNGKPVEKTVAKGEAPKVLEQLRADVERLKLLTSCLISKR